MRDGASAGQECGDARCASGQVCGEAAMWGALRGLIFKRKQADKRRKRTKTKGNRVRRGMR